jgi:hypothetical protein
LKIRNLTLKDAKAHKVFKDCTSIQDIEEKFKHCLLHGMADIIEDQNKYHLVLFDDISDMKKENNLTLIIDAELELLKTCHNEINLNLSKLAELIENELNTLDELESQYYFYKFENDLDLIRNNFKKKRAVDHLLQVVMIFWSMKDRELIF